MNMDGGYLPTCNPLARVPFMIQFLLSNLHKKRKNLFKHSQNICRYIRKMLALIRELFPAQSLYLRQELTINEFIFQFQSISTRANSYFHKDFYCKIVDEFIRL